MAGHHFLIVVHQTLMNRYHFLIIVLSGEMDGHHFLMTVHQPLINGHQKVMTVLSDLMTVSPIFVEHSSGASARGPTFVRLRIGLSDDPARREEIAEIKATLAGAVWPPTSG